MTFDELKDFIGNRMRLSHIYQPLLIEALIDAGGVSTLRQLANTFVQFDESQLIVYEKTLKKMPIPVLSRHEVIKREDDIIRLNIGPLTLPQRAELKRLCQNRLQEYIKLRGLSIWDYKLLDETPVSDSLRYRVLTEAKGRCALCGITKDQRPLDVDHIIPKSKGGKTEYANLQVLCSKCNRSKGNKDRSDFRLQPIVRVLECVLCKVAESDEVVEKTDVAYAIRDKYPVSSGHTLVITYRHFADPFEMTEAEWCSVKNLLNILRHKLSEEDTSIVGFNVGFNAGAAAGQTISHCHIHIIPKRKGDIEDPTGGVRGVIPEKRIYLK